MATSSRSSRERTGTDDAIVRFYRGEGRDGAGRTIEEVWAFSAVRLELTHDFIQWLFPLRDRSAFVPGAPTLTDATVAAFHESSDLRDRLRRSLDVMLAFYGLRRDAERPARSRSNRHPSSRSADRSGGAPATTTTGG